MVTLTKTILDWAKEHHVKQDGLELLFRGLSAVGMKMPGDTEYHHLPRSMYLVKKLMRIEVDTMTLHCS